MKIIKCKSFMIKLGIKVKSKLKVKKLKHLNFENSIFQKDLVLFQNHKKSIST